ncbi:MAG: head GIN domain-containing protein [Tenuifilaceae bacterium]|nr:head GIN domain-containing protein [Tenuifilaceae bacterium]
MKTVRSIVTKLLLVSIVLSLASCGKWDIFGMKGKGPVVSEDINFALVEGIILDIPANVYLTQGDEQSIRIEAQQNILDNILLYDKDGIFKVTFDDNVTQCKTISIYMTIQNLQKIHLRGAGNIVSESEFACNDNLEISISGAGKADIIADARKVDLTISGAGQINFETVCETLNSNISGSGDINLLAGTALTANFKTSGSGKINAYDFIIEECSINISGAGNNYVNVSENLNIRISGIGNAYYRGNPKLTVNITGLGKVINDNK